VEKRDFPQQIAISPNHFRNTLYYDRDAHQRFVRVAFPRKVHQVQAVSELVQYSLALRLVSAKFEQQSLQVRLHVV
jgi:hypothetical protein